MQLLTWLCNSNVLTMTDNGCECEILTFLQRMVGFYDVTEMLGHIVTCIKQDNQHKQLQSQPTQLIHTPFLLECYVNFKANG